MNQLGLSERILQTVVTPLDSSIRLDLWLTRKFTYRSRHQWQKLISEGKILLNQQRVRSSRLLREKEIVSFLPPEELQEPEVDPTFQIIYEDDELLIINKSGNLPCHPAGPFFKNTLWGILKERYQNIHISTRLDRETSGLVVCTKNAESAAIVNKKMSHPEGLKKYYLALVKGNFTHPIEATGFLIKDLDSVILKKRKFILSQKDQKDPKDAESAMTQLFPYATGNGWSLVKAIPQTGRLHQIRATLYSLGYPLAGDKIYGENERLYLKFIANHLSSIDYELLLLRRQALHAYRIEMLHPVTQKKLNFEIPLSDDIQSVCEKKRIRIP